LQIARSPALERSPSLWHKLCNYLCSGESEANIAPGQLALDALAIVLKFVVVFMAMDHKAGANRAIPPLKSEVLYKSEVG
jgi:hypothetical protein